MSDQNITKKALVDAFKQVMQNKPFDKISVSDITNVCHLNRQTFYYHFEDKYDLMNWLYYQEIFLPLVETLNHQNYHQSFQEMFEKMLQEKAIYQNALTMSSDFGFKQYLYSILEQLVIMIFDNHQTNRNEEIYALDIQFYTHGLTGIIIDWVNKGMRIKPSELADEMNKLITHGKKMV